MIKSMKGAFCLKGKTAIVTGGNRGIGLGIAEAFAQQGANVAILCRDEKTANAVVDRFSKEYDGKFAFYRTDVTDKDNCKASVNAVAADFGGIDILVNNSGIGVTGRLLDMDESLSDWDRCLDVDLYGGLRMTYFAAKHMVSAGKGGKIINITSNASLVINKPVPLNAYSVAKAAFNQMTKAWATELGEYGINVNAIAPGYTNSDLAKDIDAELKGILLSKMPISRFGEPIEIGALAVYLASEASEMMTGVILAIDGGYVLAV